MYERRIEDGLYGSASGSPLRQVLSIILHSTSEVILSLLDASLTIPCDGRFIAHCALREVGCQFQSARVTTILVGPFPNVSGIHAAEWRLETYSCSHQPEGAKLRDGGSFRFLVIRICSAKTSRHRGSYTWVRWLRFQSPEERMRSS